ncbi:WD repeat and FYVE domain-containing protein 1 [Sciurus carolinensis]|uniref:WD repeat and FYVE domain-containing protein 1 n=1 Tax=Sciurus carolinensis TaxID=30640 RepID=A0AA41MVS6_SCICA|nr:WD repeat and FYVE domain-containing protein 1 [Sciurus carolinensis]
MGSVMCICSDRVQSLCYLQLTRQLVSCSSDGGIAVWNMDVSREEAPQWLESDSCQKCEQPFFWNIKQMWDTKTLGLRQHHCRKCGQAVCGKCSSKRSSYPIMGFEFQVRVCDSCYDSIKDEDRTSLATFHEGKHNISHMSMDIARGLMVTCGTDRVVKVCELDIIFNFEKAYFILDEFIIGGEIQETSKKTAVKAIEDSDMLQEVSTIFRAIGKDDDDDSDNIVNNYNIRPGDPIIPAIRRLRQEDCKFKSSTWATWGHPVSKNKTGWECS